MVALVLRSPEENFHHKGQKNSGIINLVIKKCEVYFKHSVVVTDTIQNLHCAYGAIITGQKLRLAYPLAKNPEVCGLN